MATITSNPMSKTDGKNEEGNPKKRKKNNQPREVEQRSHESTSGVCGFWFTEDLTAGLALHSKINNIIFNDKSPFQDIKIVDTVPFGKVLVLDDKTQSSEKDEFIYHESLVHPAMILHPNPKTVFIGGGGEGATAREILKHTSVEKVVMVDIDKKVCDISRKYLSSWSDGAFEDPRFEIYYTDAKEWMENYKGTFDVIIMDIADPIEAGPGLMLYTQEFYSILSSKMNDGSVFVTQSGPGGLRTFTECFTVIYKTLKTSFDNVLPYLAEIPSFGCRWAFNIAFNVSIKTRSPINPANIDIMIKSRLDGSKNIHKSLRFYDGQTHTRMFSIPKYMRETMETETRIMTKDTQVFMF